MNYNHPQQLKAVRWLHLAVGFLFCIFCYFFLWKVQGVLLGVGQHILSEGQTVYEPAVGALVLTLSLFLLQKVLSRLLNLDPFCYVFSYFPSFLCLIVLSNVSACLYEGRWSHWLWISLLLLILYVGVLFILKNTHRFIKHGSDVEITLLQPNMLWMSLFIAMTMICSNTDSLLYQQCSVENEINHGNWDEALQIGDYREDCTATTEALRAYVLARQGKLADALFVYPHPHASEGLWIPRADSIRILFNPDSLYFYLGAYPSAKTTSAVQFLEYLNLSVSQCKPMARDYLLCAYLLDKNLPQFVQELQQKQGVADSIVYPKHYQEALVLYKHRVDPKFAYQNDEMEQKFTAYQDLLRSKTERIQSAGITKSAYEQTYWWYYDCYQN